MSEQESQSGTESLATELLAVLTKVEEGERAASARWTRQGQQWEQAQRAADTRAGRLIARLEEVAGGSARLVQDLAHLTRRQERASDPWVGAWSRREWRAVAGAVGVGAVIGIAGYYLAGPVKELRQENAALRQEVAAYKRVWWDKATEEQRAKILSQDARPQE